MRELPPDPAKEAKSSEFSKKITNHNKFLLISKAQSKNLKTSARLFQQKRSLKIDDAARL